LQENSQIGPSSSTQSVVVVDRVDGVLPKSDRAAVGLAISQLGHEVTVCSPEFDEVALRYALAAGVKGVVPWDGCQADILVFGRGGAGPSGDLRPARVALSRHAHLVLEVLEFSRQADGVHVIRDLGRGAREILLLSVPIVLVISDSAAIPNYVSRYRQMKVTMNLPARDFSGESASTKSIRWQPFRPRTKTADLVQKTTGDANSRMFNVFGLAEDALSSANTNVISADPQTCASHLARYLAHHGFLDSRFDASEITPAAYGDVQPAKPDRLAGAQRIGRSTYPTTAMTETRVPRPLAGQSPGVARRPQPWRPSDPYQSKLVRGPRPLGKSRPARLRGPFPATPQGSE
jgi:electron transfer flavoprotein alpha/beta subunit